MSIIRRVLRSASAFLILVFAFFGAMEGFRRVLVTVLPFIILIEYTALATSYWWWPFESRWVIPLTPRIRGTRPGG